MDRSQDRFAQAERDLAQAKESRENGRHEWACFITERFRARRLCAL